VVLEGGAGTEDRVECPLVDCIWRSGVKEVTVEPCLEEKPAGYIYAAEECAVFSGISECLRGRI